jgi:hypothetical protein
MPACRSARPWPAFRPISSSPPRQLNSVLASDGGDDLASAEHHGPSIMTTMPSRKAIRDRPSQFLNLSHTSGVIFPHISLARRHIRSDRIKSDYIIR